MPNEKFFYEEVPRARTTFGAGARVGHILCGTYLRRFDLAVSPNRQVCNAGDEETSEHILLK